MNFNIAIHPFLNSIDIRQIDEKTLPFRFAVSTVESLDEKFRGHILSGTISPQDDIIALPSGQRSTVKSIKIRDDQGKHNGSSYAEIELSGKIDFPTDQLFCTTKHICDQSDQFRAELFWESTSEMIPGRQYHLVTPCQTTLAYISRLKHRIEPSDRSKIPAMTLQREQIASVNLSLDSPVAFDPFTENPFAGIFILKDIETGERVGSGRLDYSLRRAKNVVWQALAISKTERAAQKKQKPAVLWFTGLSGSGKSTIANLLEKHLFNIGRHTYTLDGDNVRHGLNRDLGFTDADRVENIRRVAEIARLMSDAGLIVLTAFISPFRAERKMARDLMADREFIEIHVNTPLEVAEARDVKGLYAKARAGQIKNFTGIDSDYERPENPEITINTVDLSAEEAAEAVMDYLKSKGYLDA